jgi:hypothetical protein
VQGHLRGARIQRQSTRECTGAPPAKPAQARALSRRHRHGAEGGGRLEETHLRGDRSDVARGRHSPGWNARRRSPGKSLIASVREATHAVTSRRRGVSFPDAVVAGPVDTMTAGG